jgi:hypothetical protein
MPIKNTQSKQHSRKRNGSLRNIAGLDWYRTVSGFIRGAPDGGGAYTNPPLYHSYWGGSASLPVIAASVIAAAAIHAGKQDEGEPNPQNGGLLEHPAARGYIMGAVMLWLCDASKRVHKGVHETKTENLETTQLLIA